jgi:Glycoside Hydrolase Family 113
VAERLRLGVALALALALAAGSASAAPSPSALPPGADGWASSGFGAIRGVTIGPIESALHPDKGYGSAAYLRTLREARALGATWVSLTPFGRVWDLSPTGVSPTFEADFSDNKTAVTRAIEQAHREGLSVFLVPHLWVETGGWRALIDPGDDDAWAKWAASYREFVLGWARVARDSDAEMFSVGVELRSWVTTSRAPSFSAIIHDVRGVYPGLVTYCGNWDDVEKTVILGDLDVIGVNAFFPLADKDGASRATLMQGGRDVAKKMGALAQSWQKPLMFSEFGYTTRKNPAIRPWEWPDAMKNVEVDELAQAEAYYALLSGFVDEPRFAGFFVWRLYADPDDMSQEAEWGFSPRGKVAELVLRDALGSWWPADGPRRAGSALTHFGSYHVGWY